jgi:hypothetical protein
MRCSPFVWREDAVVGRWLAERAADGAASEETAVFVRSPLELPPRSVEAAGYPSRCWMTTRRRRAIACPSGPCT